jgi:hypothetical protein
VCGGGRFAYNLTDMMNGSIGNQSILDIANTVKKTEYGEERSDPRHEGIVYSSCIL